MRQQINLYRYIKQPETKQLQTRTFLTTIGLFTLLLMLFYFYQLSKQYVLARQVVELNKQLIISKQKLIAAVAKYPQMKLDENMSKLPPCDIRFSRYLTAFAHAYVNGVWLTDIDISAGGKQVMLKGRALRAQQVQSYLDRLKQEPILAPLGLEIKDLTSVTETSTTDPEISTEILNFRITSPTTGVTNA